MTQKNLKLTMTPKTTLGVSLGNAQKNLESTLAPFYVGPPGPASEATQELQDDVDQIKQDFDEYSDINLRILWLIKIGEPT